MKFIDKILKEAKEVRLKFKMNIPADVMEIAQALHKSGFELYVVGGAVRDAYKGKKIKDYDLTTDATPDQVETVMNKYGFKNLPLGKAYGVIKVFTHTDEYEIATFREDVGSADGRRPDSVKFTTIDVDVSRRDLTINALFYDIVKGEIIDLVGGLADIDNNRVRTVGDAVARFGEDRLRILRAIRFATRMEAELDEDIDAALRANNSLAGVSAERIRDEFLKCIMTAKKLTYLFELIERYDLWPQILPGLSVDTIPFYSNDPIVVLGIILRNNDLGTMNSKLDKLKYAVPDRKSIMFLIKLLSLTEDNAAELKKNFVSGNVQLSANQIFAFGHRMNLDEKLVRAFWDFKLTVDGDEIMQQTGLKNKELGDYIASLERQNFKASI